MIENPWKIDHAHSFLPSHYHPNPGLGINFGYDCIISQYRGMIWTSAPPRWTECRHCRQSPTPVQLCHLPPRRTLSSPPAVLELPFPMAFCPATP
jgi:hypothetical protein